MEKIRPFNDKIEFRWEIYSKIDPVNGEKLLLHLRYVKEWFTAKAF